MDPGGHCSDRESNAQRPCGQPEGRGRPEATLGWKQVWGPGWSAASQAHHEPSPGIKAHGWDRRCQGKPSTSFSRNDATLPFSKPKNQHWSRLLEACLTDKVTGI